MAWMKAAAVAAVLVAPAGLAAQEHSQGKETPVKDIVGVAVEAGSFGTLVKAVQAAGLVEALQGTGPFTVFAPTDAAFAQLPADTLAALLADPQRLGRILLYHVLPGHIASTEIVAAGGARPVTLNGQSLAIEVKEGKVQVDGATVTAADIPASNGIIHVIDTVLVPKPAPAPAGR